MGLVRRKPDLAIDAENFVATEPEGDAPRVPSLYTLADCTAEKR
jgi:hypothetical protein